VIVSALVRPMGQRGHLPRPKDYIVAVNQLGAAHLGLGARNLRLDARLLGGPVVKEI
jgi:hypothetical protein